MYRMKLISMGKYLPERVVPSVEIDRKLSVAPGTSEKASGVRQRRWVRDPIEESNSIMAGRAVLAALEKARLKFEDLDALIYASGSQEQSIPCTASLVLRALGKPSARTATFDVNSTCLSFLTGFDLASSLLETGRFRRLAIVSSEIASIGIDFEHHESAALFGDGAVAAILEKTPASETSHVFYANMETHSKGAETCQIAGGGSRLHPKIHWKAGNEKIYLFQMDGRKVFKLVLETLPKFFDRCLEEMKLSLDDFKLIVPHQASGSGMELVRRKLDLPSEKFMDILAENGNMIAASIPLALMTAIEEKRISRGDRVMLLGTSAGMSVGLLGFEY